LLKLWKSLLEKRYRILLEDEKHAATAQDAGKDIGVILGDFPGADSGGFTYNLNNALQNLAHEYSTPLNGKDDTQDPDGAIHPPPPTMPSVVGVVGGGVASAWNQC
jgi:hypothetical protein